jgi:nucleoside-diphosphate-sugar epimerase
MKVLVTGDRGYIGCLMTKGLAERGHEVVGLDTDYFCDGDFGTKPAGCLSSKKDLRDLTAADLPRVDAVIHLAALSNDPLGNLRSEWTFDINHKATVRMAELAKRAGVRRFLYSSSCSMYGAAGNDILTEEAPLNPVTPYAVSKVRSEQDLSRLADEHFSPTFLRNATVYGASPRLRIDIVLNNLMGWAVTSGKVCILSDGTPWRPMVHVQDLIKSFIFVLEAPVDLIHNQAFNVGANSENYQVRDLAEAVRQVVPKSSIEYAGQGGPDPRNYRVSFDKFARTFPEFQPRWNAQRGAQELYEAYREVGMTSEMFQGRKFIRLKQLEYLLATKQLDDSLRWNEARRP